MKARFGGKCFRCGRDVKPFGGYFQPVGSLSKPMREKYLGKKWLLRCIGCVGTGNK